MGCSNSSNGGGGSSLSRISRVSQRRQHVARGLYGVEPHPAGPCRVRRDAGYVHVEPQHADLGDGDVVWMGLGDDARVGPRPVEQALQGPVARAFLLDHGLELHRGGGRVPGAAQRPHRAGHRGEAGLHVPSAAAVEPVAVAHRFIRRVRPQLLGGRRHDVDVAVEDQGPPAGFAYPTARGPVGDDVALAPDIPAERRGASRRAQGFGVERDAARLQAAVGERCLHDLLPLLLGAEDGRRFDEANEQVLHPASLGGDGVEHGLVRRAVHPTLPSRIWSVFRSE